MTNNCGRSSCNTSLWDMHYKKEICLCYVICTDGSKRGKGKVQYLNLHTTAAHYWQMQLDDEADYAKYSKFW